MTRAVDRFLLDVTRGTAEGALGVHDVLRGASRAGLDVPGAEHCVLRCAAPGSGAHRWWTVDGAPVQEELDAPDSRTRRAWQRWNELPALTAALTRRGPVHDPGTAPDLAGRVRRGSTLAVPLLTGAGTVHGALVLTAARPGTFAGPDERSAATLALGCALAVESAHLLALERAGRAQAEERAAGASRAASRAALLQRITTLLQTSATTRDIARLVPRAVAEVLDCYSVALYVLDGQVLDASGYPDLPPGQEVLLRLPLDGDFPVAQAVREVRPVLVTVAESARYAGLRHLDPGPLVLSLAVPLVGRDRRPLGALLVNWSQGQRLDVDVDLFAGVAAQLAVALERAQLLDAERASREELRVTADALADVARDLQQGLLPARLPELERLAVAARYQPAVAGADIGGDWYDVVVTDRDVVLVIGDVQGHNTRAAALMGRLSTALKAYLTEGHTPGAALERVGRLLADLDTERLATCCLVRLDLGSGAATVASAGHPPPVVVDADGLRSLAVDPGPPLGTSRDAVYPEAAHRLRGPASLVLHTDGVVEDRACGSEAGERALAATLAARHGADPAVLATALAEGIPHRLVDDAALLVAVWAGTDETVREVSLELPADVRAVTTARRALRRHLREWGATAVLDEAELVLSELVTNALVHTDGGAVLGLRHARDDRAVTISVRDSSTRHPTERHAGDDALGGRGLGIVEVLADDWGVELGGEGKTVWATLLPR